MVKILLLITIRLLLRNHAQLRMHGVGALGKEAWGFSQRNLKPTYSRQAGMDIEYRHDNDALKVAYLSWSTLHNALFRT